MWHAWKQIFGIFVIASGELQKKKKKKKEIGHTYVDYLQNLSILQRGFKAICSGDLSSTKNKQKRELALSEPPLNK